MYAVEYALNGYFKKYSLLEIFRLEIKIVVLFIQNFSYIKHLIIES